MLTKVKTKAWKKVVVMGISLSLSGFVPIMTQGYAFASENPEMVDIIHSDVYQNEVVENQIMENESTDGPEKINLQDTIQENSTKNEEVLPEESDTVETEDETADDNEETIIEDENADSNKPDNESESDNKEETLTEDTVQSQDSVQTQEDDADFIIPEDDEEEVIHTEEEDADFIIPEDDDDIIEEIDEESVEQDVDEDVEETDADVEDDSDLEDDADMVTESEGDSDEITEDISDENIDSDADITESDEETEASEDDTYIMEDNNDEITDENTDEITDTPSEADDADFMIPEEEDEDMMMAAEDDDEELALDSEEEVIEIPEGKYDLSEMDTTEDTQEDPVISEDSTEELSIEEQFPESYQPLLQKLLENHPGWKMEAANTGIDWETALDAEDAGSTNLISPSAPKAQKEKSNKKYDGRWDLANRETIAYYMDPRNFLNEDGIYQFLDQTYDAESQNVDTVAAVIEGSFMEDADPEEGYESFAACIDDVGAETDVNPNVLAAMIIEEQGWEGSSLSSGKKEGYEGYYNFMNIGAWTTDSMSSTERGLWYAKGEGKKKKSYERPWDSPAKAIKGGAEVYSENYIANNQDTYYTKKFNVMNGEEAVGTHQYMTNVQAAADEGSLVKRAYKKENKNLPALFKIPVFENMPEEICALPGK